MTPKSPGARLLAAAGYARQGKFIADVGTDHAYLPVYLAEAGVSAGAVATDINRGPLERAAANVAAAGLSDKITLRLADGIDGVEAFCPEDIFILGMGGELIARILGNSDYIKNENIRLILQPMTRQAALRRFLLDSGFLIEDERLVLGDGGRIYQIICAHWDGVRRSAAEAALAVGAINLSRGGELLGEYTARLARELRVSADGKRRGGDTAAADTDEEAARRLLAGGAYSYYET